MPILIFDGFQRAHPGGKTNAFVQRLSDFLGILTIGRRVLYALSIEHGDPTPAFQQREEIRGFTTSHSTRPFRRYLSAMVQEFIKNDDFLGVIHFSNFGLAMKRTEIFVTMKNFFDLNRVIGQCFCTGINRCQAATDNTGREADLHVGQGGFLCGASELETHQEVRSLANATDEVVL